MARQPENTGTGRQPASRADLSRGKLVEVWERAYGQPPPKGIGSRLLILAAAYHRQAREQGGLRPDTKENLLAYRTEGKSDAQNTRRGAAPDTRLIRHWHGEAHIVDVMEDGVLYRGETFRSLTEVAGRITGVKWSGPRFFGLTRQ